MRQEINTINISSHIPNIKEPKLKESQSSSADHKPSNRTQIQDNYRWKTLKMLTTFSNLSISNWETWKMSTSAECKFFYFISGKSKYDLKNSRKWSTATDLKEKTNLWYKRWYLNKSSVSIISTFLES